MRALPRALAILAALPAAASAAADHDLDPEQRAVAAEVAERSELTAREARDLLAAAEHDAEALERLRAPAEALPWHEYRAILVTEERIRRGATFASEHGEVLEAASAEYGIPASVLTAVLGVESRYGEHTGEHRVLDALATLAFSDHRRAPFFRDELATFLVLGAEGHWDPERLKGSYAGAFGKPQFIPSSFEAYAVDHTGDGSRDLVHSLGDALGSAANYLERHGWRDGAPVAQRVSAEGDDWRAALSRTDAPVEPVRTAAELRELGVDVPAEVADRREVALIELDGGDEAELWLTFNNFYVLTRYNHSALYAMAVHQLAQAIEEARNR